MATPQTVVSKPLHVPPLEEVAQVFKSALEESFKNVEVSVVECPDLRKEPFFLSAPGLSGSQRLAEVGGVPYLMPLVQKDKIYKFPTIGQQIDLPDAFLIGAGAGPHHLLGVNCELIPNVNLGSNVNNTHVALIAKDGTCDLRKMPNAELTLLGNLYASKGETGPVVKVVASHRTGPDNFVSLLRKALAQHFGDKPVGVGGTFLIKKGTAKIHIMPDFSETPLRTNEDLNSWLRFYNFSAPLICVGTFVSADPGLDLRVEHTHCFSQHGVGGHYHQDTSPEGVEYEAYFNVAEFVYRIDQPTVTHLIGRD